MAGMNIKPATTHPLATQEIDGMIEMISDLIEKGFAREEAYDTVQPVAMKAWSEGLDYKTLLQQNEKVTAALSASELDECFTIEYYFKNVDYIYNRVGIQ